MPHAIQFDDDFGNIAEYSVLKCPACGEATGTHLDEVHVGGRPVEDGPWENVTVNSKGKVHTDAADGAMAAPPIAMRRHYISLVGWCEHCRNRFAFAFVQHKGKTHVQAIVNRWTPLPKPE